MDRSKEFIQYQIENPHNVSFKSLVGYEDREDTIKGFKRMLDAKSNIRVGDLVYVLTRYSGLDDEEVVECKVTRLTHKRIFTFSVVGKYKNGNYYNANFTESSIGTKVFCSKDEVKNN